MALCELKIYSESLGMQTTVNVVIPQQSTRGEIGIENNVTENKYKCLYLLHGLSDDESIWLRRTSIERYATEYGICVVMPSGAKSFYTDMKYGGKYYTYIAKELPAIIQKMFNVSEKREDNFIAGNSMGGYGALKIAFKECDKFGAVAGLSSVADIKSRAERFKETYIPIFGEDILISDSEDLFKLAELAGENSVKPRVYTVVGTEDFLYEDNVKFKKKMESLEFDYTYKELPGFHNWIFWDEEIKDVLKWMFD